MMRILTFVTFIYHISVVLTHASSVESYDGELSLEDQYQKAVSLRKAHNYGEAIPLFKQLVENVDIETELLQKSQHNLANCYHQIGNEQETYVWFRAAASSGFEPSQRNLNKLNLLNTAIPLEILEIIVSYLSLRDMAAFSQSSKRNAHAVTSVLSRLNFLTSVAPCASEVRAMFQRTTIEPAPSALRLFRQKIVEDSNVEVHFRDTDHLRKLADQTSLIQRSPNCRIYYIHDKDVSDGEEIRADDGQTIESQWLFRFKSDNPLELKGELTLPIGLALPGQSTMKHLHGRIERGVIDGKLSEYDNGHALANALDNFNPTLLDLRTKDATALLDEKKLSRLRDSSFYPALDEICPRLLILSTRGDSEERQGDYITSKDHLFHFARTREEMRDLLEDYPDFEKSILCVNAHKVDDPIGRGVYSKGPLRIVKYFHLISPGDFIISGDIKIIDYSIKIESKADMYLLSLNILAGGSIRVSSDGSLAMIGDITSQEPFSGVPSAYWMQVKRWWQRELGQI